MNGHPLFNRIAEGLSDEGWFVLPEFVSKEDALAIRDQAMAFREDGEFRRAGIGKQVEYQKDKDIRGDEILWVDRDHLTPETSRYLERMENLKIYLNQTCYLGIRDYEVHFAVYPKGTFYARHSDRFRHNAHRVISFVLYLNPDWERADGGQLMIYPESGKPIEILPEAGKLVCFRSEIEHEVLECHRSRYSLTGWLLDTAVGLTFL